MKRQTPTAPVLRRCTKAAVSILLLAPLALVSRASPTDPEEGQPDPSWIKVWESAQSRARIARLIDAVNPQRMSDQLFCLAKDPLPFRKLNYTLPGHTKNTLHEADDYLAGRLESWGYHVQREAVPVQAYRRDTTKPLQHQYAQPMPEDPWYTACSDPNYHVAGDVPERCDVPNAAMTVRATLAAILTLEQAR